MGLARKTAVKVFDGFAKTTGAGLATALGALLIWAFSNVNLQRETASQEKSYDFYPYDDQQKRVESLGDGTWVTGKAVPFYDYIDTWTPSLKSPPSYRGWYGLGGDYAAKAYGYDYTVIDKLGKKVEVRPDTSIEVSPDSYDAYFYTPRKKHAAADSPQVAQDDLGWVDTGYYRLWNPAQASQGPKRTKRVSGEVWGDYGPIAAKSTGSRQTDWYVDYAEPGYSYDYSYPMQPKKAPTSAPVLGAPAGDRT